MKPFSLTKQERLKSKKEIDTLFLHGEAFFVFPFKIIYNLQPATSTENKYPVQFLATVPKRKFKKATQRNTIRRRIKESYRINKQELYESLKTKQKQLHILFIYNHVEELAYAQINEKMKIVLKKIISIL